MKRTIILKESELRRMISESVKMVLAESDGWKDQYSDGEYDIQSKGTGKDKQWRRTKKQKNDDESDGWKDQYSDGEYDIQSKGTGKDKQWRRTKKQKN